MKKVFVYTPCLLTEGPVVPPLAAHEAGKENSRNQKIYAEFSQIFPIFSEFSYFLAYLINIFISDLDPPSFFQGPYTHYKHYKQPP